MRRLWRMIKKSFWAGWKIGEEEYKKKERKING